VVLFGNAGSAPESEAVAVLIRVVSCVLLQAVGTAAPPVTLHSAVSVAMVGNWASVKLPEISEKAGCEQTKGTGSRKCVEPVLTPNRSAI